MSLFIGKAVFIVCALLAIVVLYKIGTLLFAQRDKQ
jgi:hypothetical protein